MEYSADFEREDDIDLNEIDGQIEIWHASAIMDGGTIFLNCRYNDKLFKIVSKQWTVLAKFDIEREFLYINKNAIKVNSEEEKIIVRLIKESINTADNLRFFPKFVKILIWSRRKPVYWIEIFKKEILNFITSKEYLEFAKTKV